MGADPLIQLAVANVDRDNFPGSSLKDTVGKPSCRRTDINYAFTSDFNLKTIKCSIELLAASRNELAS
jgi:hypothetical protein